MTEPRLSRRVVWLSLLFAWAPLWGLFVALIMTAHQDAQLHSALLIGLRGMVAAALLGIGVQRLTDRLPWPHPFRPWFVAVHLLAAALYAVAWFLLNSVIESLLRREPVLAVGVGVGPFVVLGMWIYVIVAGISYAARATGRAARAEAAAARSQLAALRAQLNPHFLFNALHTVVQLIPREPRRAAAAAEQLAALLRTTLEDDRDLVSLADEQTFVDGYLALERLRFGDRLRVHVDLDDEAREAMLPSFAVQTLVENAVRHGAAPRVEPTDLRVSGRLAGGTLTIAVADTGAGATAEQIAASRGSGLRRLRERLDALYEGRARLDLATAPGGGFTATLRVPQDPAWKVTDE